MLASEVLTHSAKVYLNDSAQVMWTNTVLLPALTEAGLRLATLLEVNEIPNTKRKSLTITAEAGDTELDEYPTDFSKPLNLRERPMGGTAEQWSDPIDEVNEIDPSLDNNTSIIQWNFSNQKVYFNPPTTDRDVTMLYIGTMTDITAVGSVIDIPQAKSYLAIQTAAIAALNIGNNPTRAAELEPQMEKIEDLLVTALLKNTQTSAKTRRRPYSGYSKF